MRQITSFLSLIDIGDWDFGNLVCTMYRTFLLVSFPFVGIRFQHHGTGCWVAAIWMVCLPMHLSSSSCGRFLSCKHLSDRLSLSERYQDLCIFAFYFSDVCSMLPLVYCCIYFQLQE